MTNFQCIDISSLPNGKRIEYETTLSSIQEPLTHIYFSNLISSKFWGALNLEANAITINQNQLGKDVEFRSLMNGKNILDITSGNSGINSCKADVEISFVSDIGKVFTHVFSIRDNDINLINNTFKTELTNPSYRICDRIHIPIQVKLSNKIQ
jgi:hypothetical protein